MKKLFLIAVWFLAGVYAFCQNVSDYFPAQAGYKWEYKGTNGKITDIYTCVAIERINDNEDLVGFLIESLGITTKAGYRSIKNTGVFEYFTIAANGNENIHYDDPFVILALREEKWQEEDRGDIFLCQSKKTSVSFDGKTYSDCIVVEKAIFINNQPLMIKRQYFARGIGLVYVSLQGKDGVERPHLRLASYKF